MMAGFTILEPFLMASPAPMKWPKMLDTVPIRPRTRKTLPLKKAGQERGDIGGQIHEFNVAARCAHVKFAEIAENEQQERACPGAVEPVVCADDERCQIDDSHLLFWLDIAAFLRQLTLPQHDEGHDRQHDQQQVL